MCKQQQQIVIHVTLVVVLLLLVSVSGLHRCYQCASSHHSAVVSPSDPDSGGCEDINVGCCADPFNNGTVSGSRSASCDLCIKVRYTWEGSRSRLPAHTALYRRFCYRAPRYGVLPGIRQYVGTPQDRVDRVLAEVTWTNYNGRVEEEETAEEESSGEGEGDMPTDFIPLVGEDEDEGGKDVIQCDLVEDVGEVRERVLAARCGELVVGTPSGEVRVEMCGCVGDYCNTATTSKPTHTTGILLAAMSSATSIIGLLLLAI